MAEIRKHEKKKLVPVMRRSFPFFNRMYSVISSIKLSNLREFKHVQKVERTLVYSKDRCLFRSNYFFIFEGNVNKIQKKLTKDMKDHLMASLIKEHPLELLEFFMPIIEDTENSLKN